MVSICFSSVVPFIYCCKVEDKRVIQRAYIHFIWIGLLLASGAEAVRIQDAVAEEVPKRQHDGYYAAVGLGFINLDHRGAGVRVPLGFRAVFNRLRLICSANALDVSFHEGDDYDPRFFRPYPTRSYCFDTRTGYRVADYRCSGGTDWLRSLSADVAYIVLDEVWIAGRPGKLFAGAGYRHLSPETVYGTLGLFFDAPGQTVGGFKVLVGKGYVTLGLLWGFDLRRVF